MKRSLSQNAAVKSSLVVQWLRTRLPVQGTQLQPLVQEDPVCHRPLSLRASAAEPVLLKPTGWEPALRNTRGHRGEKPAFHS